MTIEWRHMCKENSVLSVRKCTESVLVSVKVNTGGALGHSAQDIYVWWMNWWLQYNVFILKYIFVTYITLHKDPELDTKLLPWMRQMNRECADTRYTHASTAMMMSHTSPLLRQVRIAYFQAICPMEIRLQTYCIYIFVSCHFLLSSSSLTWFLSSIVDGVPRASNSHRYSSDIVYDIVAYTHTHTRQPNSPKTLYLFDFYVFLEMLEKKWAQGGESGAFVFDACVCVCMWIGWKSKAKNVSVSKKGARTKLFANLIQRI